MKLTDVQETAALLGSRALNRAQHAIAESERIDELTLYLTQRGKWIEQTAPRTAALMAKWNDAEAQQTWEHIGRDYQRAVWKYMDATQRARIKRLRQVSA